MPEIVAKSQKLCETVQSCEDLIQETYVVLKI